MRESILYKKGSFWHLLPTHDQRTQVFFCEREAKTWAKSNGWHVFRVKKLDRD
jgi:hypothetical protein